MWITSLYPPQRSLLPVFNPSLHRTFESMAYTGFWLVKPKHFSGVQNMKAIWYQVSIIMKGVIKKNPFEFLKCYTCDHSTMIVHCRGAGWRLKTTDCTGDSVLPFSVFLEFGQYTVEFIVIWHCRNSTSKTPRWLQKTCLLYTSRCV